MGYNRISSISEKIEKENAESIKKIFGHSFRIGTSYLNLEGFVCRISFCPNLMVGEEIKRVKITIRTENNTAIGEYLITLNDKLGIDENEIKRVAKQYRTDLDIYRIKRVLS